MGAKQALPPDGKAAQRGQDGAGIAAVKLNVEPGYPYMHRIRSAEEQAIPKIFKTIATEINELIKYNKDIPNHPGMMKGHVRFMGELLLGHLRYGTQGRNGEKFCHPLSDIIPYRHVAWQLRETSIW